MQVDAIAKLVEDGDLKQIEDAVQASLDEGTSAETIMDAMINALTRVGERFQQRKIFVPEMLISAMTMKRGVTVLKPSFAPRTDRSLGTFIIGTVKGDLHDIGKNIVVLMLEATGFHVVDLGVDVEPECFIDAIKANPECHVVGISALLTTTLVSMRETVRSIKDAGLTSQVRIMVGGTPVTAEFAKKIGADAYTENAAEAAQTAARLVGSAKDEIIQ